MRLRSQQNGGTAGTCVKGDQKSLAKRDVYSNETLWASLLPDTIWWTLGEYGREP